MTAEDHAHPTLAAINEDVVATETEDPATTIGTVTDGEGDHATKKMTALVEEGTATTSQTTNLVPHTVVPSDEARLCPPRRPRSP
jgi:hypothetical protein